jgi:beta-glucosidase
MKKYLFSIITIASLLLIQTTCSKYAEMPGIKIKWNSLEDIVSQMTLAEKIGQMTQAERGDLHKGDITEYFLGSILSGGGSTPGNNSPGGWLEMINGFTEESLNTRLGIPIIYGIDAVHGHNNARGAVIFPHNIALGAIAAGDLERGKKAAYSAGNTTAKEMIATGVRWTFAPVLGAAEDIRWGRTYESYSENIGIVTALGASTVRGLQENGAAACIKHYIGEGQAINGQNQGNAILDRAGIERLLPPYREAIEAGAMSLMVSFSSVNGIKMHQHRELLTDVLKGELGFQGMIISDWGAIEQLTGGSYKAQIANAINAGIDMVMATNGRDKWVDFIKLLQELAAEGTVPMSRIDDAVLRILRFKQSAGILETPVIRRAGEIGTGENRQAARAIVSDSLVLLRNENNIIQRLPSFNNILVAGHGAANIGMQCGGWTITWQGGHGPITRGTTILEGIKEAAGSAEITYASDGNTAGNFDAVIAVIGEDPYAEGDGDRVSDIPLRQRDIDMLKQVYGYNCPVIVIMLSGRPMTITDEYEKWDALIAAWLPGTEGGGIADVLFGSRDFTGKTPYTWRKTINTDILYPFGFGLSKHDRL